MKRRFIAAGLAATAVAVCFVVPGPSRATFDREFRARARAYPVEPDPGQNQTSFGFRPIAVEGGIASTPLGANGRAAVLDMGIIENQTVDGERVASEESFARCDTVSPNVPDEEERTVGVISLSALCTAGPAFEARAIGIAPAAVVPAGALDPLGVSGGEIASRAFADASGSEVVAETVSAMTDLTVGPLHIEELRFRARVEANGEAGGATAEWAVDALAADVDGVPVVIGTGGVRVDDQQVPPALLSQATAGVQEAFAQSGGFIDVRVLEPERSAADDGSSAEVKGGGLHIFLTSGTEANDREFLGLTLLGGTVRVEVGEVRTVGSLQPFTSGAPRVGGALAERADLPASAPGRFVAPASEPAVAPTAGVIAPPQVSLATATARRSLPEPSSWWAVALVGGLAILALAAASSRGPLLPARQRALGWWHVTAERFLRG